MKFSIVSYACRLIARMILMGIFLCIPHAYAHAGTLSFVSDLISTSAPGGTTTTHTIHFTTASAIPESGKIVITFDKAFSIPATFDVGDIDLAVANAGSPDTFVDRPLAAVSSGAVDGVSIVTSGTPSITITLSSDPGTGIGAGDLVRILLGDNATFDAQGVHFVTSPSPINSYHIRFSTRSSLNAEIDFGSTLIAIVRQLGITTFIPIIEPTRTNGRPSGLLPGSTQNVWLSLNTDMASACRYATSSDVQFTNMLSSTIFTSANSGFLHYRIEPVATNTIYNFYVRCRTPSLVSNTTDYLITFEVGVQPGDATSTPAPPPPPPTPPGGGGISGPGGGGGLFLNTGSVTIEGRGAPGAALIILKDGVIARESTVSQQGDFSENFQDLQRGTYMWSAYIRDQKGKVSSTYSSAIYLIAQTNNTIAPVYLSPTISATTTVGLGQPVTLRGFAIPLRPVKAIMNKQGDALNSKVVTATTTANGDGSWALTLPSDGLSKGTYEVKALSQLTDKEQSLLSPVLYIGIGENPNPNFKNRSDLNKDGKVNLIDFSILLYNWRTADAVADINQDGTVSLVDFSIMLANWTG